MSSFLPQSNDKMFAKIRTFILCINYILAFFRFHGARKLKKQNTGREINARHTATILLFITARTARKIKVPSTKLLIPAERFT